MTSNPAGMNTDQLQARYVGTGHADLAKHLWMVQQHRDTYASHIGHYDQLSYLAVAQNESVGRTRLEFLQKMIEPCGPAPQNEEED